LVNNSWF